MQHQTEPQMLVRCADMIELIEAWEKVKKNYSCKCSPRFAFEYQKASRKLANYRKKVLYT